MQTIIPTAEAAITTATDDDIMNGFLLSGDIGVGVVSSLAVGTALTAVTLTSGVV